MDYSFLIILFGLLTIFFVIPFCVLFIIFIWNVFKIRIWPIIYEKCCLEDVKTNNV